LVLLAGAVCLLTSVAAIGLFRRALATTGRSCALWAITAGTATGYGIWATHFIAMLAFSPGFATGYDTLLTLASLLAAALMTGVGFALAANRPMSSCTPVGGLFIGLGIAVMHYTGMAAFKVPGHIEWAPGLVLASILLGIVFSVAAVYASCRWRRGPAAVLGALLLATAIMAHHFTGMAAFEIRPDPAVTITALSLSPTSLAVGIAGAAVGVLSVSYIAAVAARSRQQLIERSDAEIALQAERLEAALANMSQGLSMFDDEQRLLICNARYLEIYRLSPEEAKPGTSLRQLVELRIARGLYGGSDPAAYLRELSEPFRTAPTRREMSDGRIIEITRCPMPHGGWVTTHEDVTERSRAEAKIAHLAHHDALTGLPNRALLRERLEQAVAALRQHGSPFAVLLLDLDRFKEVNDTLGHPAGDALLKIATKRLLGCVTDSDTVARLGGDEFAIIYRSPDPVTEAIALARKIRDLIVAPFDIDGHHVSIGTSVGISVAPIDGDDPDLLLRNADLALYRAKGEGGDSYCRFEPEMGLSIQARRSLEADLRNALPSREFYLHYQPLINLERNEICGFEALLRWGHPARGSVPTNVFIPVAEETGLIVQIGEWVLREACAEAANWPSHLKIAVNVSPAQFKARNFIEQITRILAATGIPPQRLELEITEKILLQDEQAAFNTLSQLHKLGVRIALDDFGTGYSSLSNLRKFPFDKIKIDRSFVSELSIANLDALAVVRSVAQLGVSLGMATTAEGVETEHQLFHVRAEGCTEMQGFYVCPPSPAEDIRRLIRDKCRTSASAA
jgi:diguanylate cyclase (GGDEF)-like protein